MIDGREGDLLADRYRLGALVGVGGTSDVRAATDLVLQRAVAVKLGRSDESGELLDQAMRVAKLDHPHVVRVLDAGMHAGRPFVVLELVDGPTLAQVVSQGGLPLADVLAVGQGVLSGLRHAHARGVLHLDLSTGNVMLPRADDGTPDPAAAVVLDLGADRRRGESGGLVAVTPHYASPEIATGRAGDERSDIYSVGALLYELATGRPPFGAAGEAADAVLRAQVHQIAPPPSTWVPGLPPAFDRLVAQALAKDPGDRHTDVDALLLDVARLASVVGTPGRDEGPRRLGDGGLAAVIRTTRQIAPIEPARAPAVLDTPGARGARAATARATPQTPSMSTGRAGQRWLAAVAALLSVAVVAGVVHAGLGADDVAGPATPPLEAPTATATATASAVVTRPSSTAPSATTAPVALPTLAGLTLDDARAALAASGLRLGGVQEADGPTPAGVVVASGYTLVPDVTGTPVAEAKAVLRERGLAVTELATPDGVAGIAVRTAPNVGQRLAVGYTVILLVGAEPEPTASPSGPPAPSATPDPAEGDP